MSNQSIISSTRTITSSNSLDNDLLEKNKKQYPNLLDQSIQCKQGPDNMIIVNDLQIDTSLQQCPQRLIPPEMAITSQMKTPLYSDVLLQQVSQEGKSRSITSEIHTEQSKYTSESPISTVTSLIPQTVCLQRLKTVLEQDPINISDSRTKVIRNRPNYCDIGNELSQKYPLEHIKRKLRQNQEQTFGHQQIRSIPPLLSKSQKQTSLLSQKIYSQEKTQLNQEIPIDSREQTKGICFRTNGILDKYEKIMEEDFDRFTQHRRCLNNTNIYLAYIFHFLQSLGIFTTTLSSTFAHTELIWVGVFLNCTASLIYIYEQLNSKIAYKLQQNILAIMQNQYQGEIELIEPQQDLNIGQEDKLQFRNKQIESLDLKLKKQETLDIENQK